MSYDGCTSVIFSYSVAAAVYLFTDRDNSGPFLATPRCPHDRPDDDAISIFSVYIGL